MSTAILEINGPVSIPGQLR